MEVVSSSSEYSSSLLKFNVEERICFGFVVFLSEIKIIFLPLILIFFNAFIKKWNYNFSVWNYEKNGDDQLLNERKNVNTLEL